MKLQLNGLTLTGPYPRVWETTRCKTTKTPLRIQLGRFHSSPQRNALWLFADGEHRERPYHADQTHKESEHLESSFISFLSFTSFHILAVPPCWSQSQMWGAHREELKETFATSHHKITARKTESAILSSLLTWNQNFKQQEKVSDAMSDSDSSSAAPAVYLRASKSFHDKQRGLCHFSSNDVSSNKADLRRTFEASHKARIHLATWNLKSKSHKDCHCAELVPQH